MIEFAEEQQATHAVVRLDEGFTGKRKWKPVTYLKLQDSVQSLNGQVEDFVVTNKVATARELRRSKVRVIPKTELGHPVRYA
jgi:hypothetical protein